MRNRLACLYCGACVKPKRPRCPKCGKAVVRALAGRFEQRQILKRRKDDVALRCWDKFEHRDVFARVLLPSANAQCQSALNAEARLLQSLTGRAGFPRFIDGGKLRDTGSLYTVQEYVPGDALPAALKKMSPSQKLDVFMGALGPVSAVHELGYVHCALSLDHFLLAKSGAIVLLDLRQARRTGLPSGGAGTPGYRAPEQWRNTPTVSAATDVYALAACIYQLLTMRFPYGKNEVKQGAKAGYVPPTPSAVNPAITNDVDDIVLQALNRLPDNRFSSVEALHHALNHRLSEATVEDGYGFSFPSWLRGSSEVMGDGIVGILRAGITAARVSGRSVAWVSSAYTNFVCRMTGATPRTAVACTMAVLVAAPLAFMVSATFSHKTSGPSTSLNSRSAHPAPAPTPGETQAKRTVISGPDARVYGDEHGFRLQPDVPSPVDPIEAPLSEAIPEGLFDDGPSPPLFSLETGGSWSQHLQVGGLPSAAVDGRAEPSAPSPRKPWSARAGFPKSRVQFLTWPPADVYVDGEYLTDAPDWLSVVVPSGVIHVRIVPRNGRCGAFTFFLLPAHRYLVKFDPYTNRVKVEDVTNGV